MYTLSCRNYLTVLLVRMLKSHKQKLILLFLRWYTGVGTAHCSGITVVGRRAAHRRTGPAEAGS